MRNEILTRAPQEVKRLLKKGARVVSSAGLVVSAALSPVDAPKIEATSQQQGQKVSEGIQSSQEVSASLKLDHGNGDPDKLSLLVIPNIGVPDPMPIRMKEELFRISPTNEFADMVNVYVSLDRVDLKCDQNAICDNNLIREQIDKLSKSQNRVFHETLVVVKSDDPHRGAGLAGYAGTPNEIQSWPSIPSLYSYSAVVLPPNFVDNLAFRVLIAHELWGHSYAAFNHEGDDLMDNCAGGKCKYHFNEQHSRVLRELVKRIGTSRYQAPRNEIIPINATQLRAQMFESRDMSLAAGVLTPTGTRQLYSEIMPAPNPLTGEPDGPAITEIIGAPALIHAWAEIGKRVPAPHIGVGDYILLPDTTMTWKVCSTGASEQIIRTDDPRWTQTEAYPGIWLLTYCDKKNFKMPKRFSDNISAKVLGSGQETNNLTPTLVWDNRDQDVFYYEVQVSTDPDFETDPQKAKAFVYWELRHGGVTNPLNSYTIPREYPLEKGKKHYWRSRPRVQADGTPVAWSSTFTFQTSADARILSPNELEVVKEPEKKVNKTVNTKQFLEDLDRVKKEEQEQNKSRDQHLQWVEQEVLTKTQIPVFENGKIAWLHYSKNVPFAAYLREDQYFSKAS